MTTTAPAPTSRTAYRNRSQALSAWRASVRDACILHLTAHGRPMSIPVLSAQVGVDIGALHGLLCNDARFVLELGEDKRSGGAQRGHRTYRFVRLPHQTPVAPRIVVGRSQAAPSLNR
jgi:hypothetical protein